MNSVAVLGIDAAWTANEPSGVALLELHGKRWCCRRVSPSYEAFCDGDTNWLASVAGGLPDVKRLLDVCTSLVGKDALVVTVDMPMAVQPITSRRAADDLISSQFGGMKCAVHSPTPDRPGEVGDAIYREFVRAGFPLALGDAGSVPALLEVYPHVALLELMNANERLPYKVGKSRKYWKEASLSKRKELLVKQWGAILERLEQEVDDIDLPLPSEPQLLSLQQLKRYEDSIDALVCAWMGIKYLNREAVALGDEVAAIWIPVRLVD